MNMKNNKGQDIHLKEDSAKKNRDHINKNGDKNCDENETLQDFNETKVEPLNFTRKSLTEKGCLSYL
jgi:hypothetical protein